MAQAPPDPKDEVEVVVMPRDGSPCRAARRGFRAFEKRRQMMQGRMHGRTLALTGCEAWSMPKAELEAFKRDSAASGVLVTELGPNGPHAFHPAPAGTRLTRLQRQLVELAKGEKATMSVRIMTAPPPAVLEHALTRDASSPGSPDAAKITVTLSDSSRRTIVRSSVDVRPDMVVWRGTVEQTGGTVTLMWWPTGKMAGTIQSDGRIHSIRHLGGRIYAVVEMSAERMPEEHAPMPERLRQLDPSLRDDPLVKQGDASLLPGLARAARPGTAPRSGKSLEAPTQRTVPAAGSAPSAAAPIVIDLIVAYTQKAASHYSDVRRELIDLSIEEANHSFRMSNLGHITLRLAHAYQTDYVEDGEHFDHLYRMVDRGDGHMEEMHGLRDQHQADVGVLIVDDAKGCGLATRVYADADDAFAVVHHVCSAATYSLAHEVGHLIGARHELGIDQSMLPFSYGHGYVNGTKWRDIMSYKASCGGCPRLPVWSSPKVEIRGEPAGTADSDNARVLAEQAARVAAFR